jgi:cyanamide hydratase
MSDSTAKYGFTALPAGPQSTPPKPSPSPVEVSSLQPPQTPLAKRVTEYVRSKLNPKTFNHSLRVYSYGLAIARECYPDWNLQPGSALEETWYLTAMLHDIGTCDEFLTATRLSFEFWGGYHALELLQKPEITGSATNDGVAPREQAESVAEAIIRHQDVQEKGMVTLITRLIHLGTLLDNAGANREMVDGKTIENVVEAYPRKGWSECFRGTVVEEKTAKPYAMVSRIEGFEDMIMGNELMNKYD